MFIFVFIIFIYNMVGNWHFSILLVKLVDKPDRGFFMMNNNFLLVLLLMFAYAFIVLNIQKTSQNLIHFYNEKILTNDESLSHIFNSYAECAEKSYIMLKENNNKNKLTIIAKNKQRNIFILSWVFIFISALLFTFILKNRQKDSRIK